MSCCLVFFGYHVIIKTIKGSDNLGHIGTIGWHTDSPEFAYVKKVDHLWNKNSTLYFLKSCDLLKMYSQCSRVFRLRIIGRGACPTDWQSVRCWKEWGQVEGLPDGGGKLRTLSGAWPLQKELGLEQSRVPLGASCFNLLIVVMSLGLCVGVLLLC